MALRKNVLALVLLAPLLALGLGEQMIAYVNQRYGGDAADRVGDWFELLQNGDGDSIESKLETVNLFFNKLAFVSDDDHWGKRDYWATPVEFLATAGGDCEDFSIAKYFTLKQLGVPVEKMRITYVRALNLKQAHMILAYYATPDAEPLVLDNLIDEIRPANQRTDLQPVYSFNGDGLWMSVQRGQGRKVGGPSGISMWRSLLARMSSEAAS